VTVPQERDAGRSIVSDSAATFLLKVLLFGLGFATSVLLSRGLGPEGRGVYYLPVIAAGTMVALCKLGLEQANVFLYGTRGLSIGRLSGQNGLVALAKVQQRGYEAVVCDIMMPVMDGIRLYQLLAHQYPEAARRVRSA